MFRLNKCELIRVGNENSLSPRRSKSANSKHKSAKSEHKSAKPEHKSTKSKHKSARLYARS